VKYTLSGLKGIKKTYITMDQGIVLYDSVVISAEQIEQAIKEKTSFGAEVAMVGPEDPSKFPKDCGFLGLFCD
jgi:hypothetical protein